MLLRVNASLNRLQALWIFNFGRMGQYFFLFGMESRCISKWWNSYNYSKQEKVLYLILNNGNKQISHVLLEVVAKDYEFSDESLNYVLANAGSFLRAR